MAGDRMMWRAVTGEKMVTENHYVQYMNERHKRIAEAIQQAVSAKTDEEKIKAGQRIEDVLEDAMRNAVYSTKGY